MHCGKNLLWKALIRNSVSKIACELKWNEYNPDMWMLVEGHPKKKKSYMFLPIHLLPFSSFYCHITLPFPDWYNWNHTVCSFFWLASCTKFFHRLEPYVSIVLNNSPLYGYITDCSSTQPIEGNSWLEAKDFDNF